MLIRYPAVATPDKPEPLAYQTPQARGWQVRTGRLIAACLCLLLAARLLWRCARELRFHCVGHVADARSSAEHGSLVAEASGGSAVVHGIVLQFVLAGRGRIGL